MLPMSPTLPATLVPPCRARRADLFGLLTVPRFLCRQGCTGTTGHVSRTALGSVATRRVSTDHVGEMTIQSLRKPGKAE